jgi:putative membrane protein
MMGFGMGFNSIWMIIFWVVIISGGIWALAALFPKANSSPPAERGDDALAILKERYARGEISKEEYQSIRYELER